MDIEGLGDKLVDQLVDSGLVPTLPSLYKLDLAQLTALDRMGEKSAANLLDALAAKRLDSILEDIPTLPLDTPPPPLNPKAPTAVLLVSSFGGLGVHTFLSIQRLFPGHFRNFIFVSVNVVDADCAIVSTVVVPHG